MSTTNTVPPIEERDTGSRTPPPRRTGWLWFGALLGVFVLVLAAIVVFNGEDEPATDEAVLDDAPAGADADTAAEPAGMDSSAVGHDDHDAEAPMAGHDDGTAAAEVIEVTMTEFGYSPASVTVAPGTPTVLRFINEGAIQHEAMLGDHHMQEEFAASTDHGDHGGAGHHGDMMAITLDPGQTGEIEFMVEEPGTWLIGCHLPGHYDAGMVATIEVTA